MYRIVCVWQAYNDGKKTTFESALTLMLAGGWMFEVVRDNKKFGNHWPRPLLTGKEDLTGYLLQLEDHKSLLSVFNTYQHTELWEVKYFKENK